MITVNDIKAILKNNPDDVAFLLKKYRVLEPVTLDGVLAAYRQAGAPFVQEFAALMQNGAVYMNPQGKLISPIRTAIEPETTSGPIGGTGGFDWSGLGGFIGQLGDVVGGFIRKPEPITPIATQQPQQAGINQNMLILGGIAAVVILIVVIIIKK